MNLFSYTDYLSPRVLRRHIVFCMFIVVLQQNRRSLAADISETGVVGTG